MIQKYTKCPVLTLKKSASSKVKFDKKRRWLKNGTAFNFPADGRISRVDKAEKLALVFKTCELDDAGIGRIFCVGKHYYFREDES